jgi:hypothetical protein
MKMKLSDDEQLVCLLAAIKFTSDHGKLLDSKYNVREMPMFEYLSEVAESIGSEWIVAKYFNLPFDPYENRHKTKADVGNAIEVKWTKYDEGQLIIGERDRVSDIAVLVVGQCPKYRIAGWIPIAMAQKPRYRHSKQPNWWVTQVNLQPIENLVRSNYGSAAI